MTHEIADLALRDCAGAREIGFAIPQAYDASRRGGPPQRGVFGGGFY
jgi:hypothetical protein